MKKDYELRANMDDVVGLLRLAKRVYEKTDHEVWIKFSGHVGELQITLNDVNHKIFGEYIYSDWGDEIPEERFKKAREKLLNCLKEGGE